MHFKSFILLLEFEFLCLEPRLKQIHLIVGTFFINVTKILHYLITLISKGIFLSVR